MASKPASKRKPAVSRAPLRVVTGPPAPQRSAPIVVVTKTAGKVARGVFGGSVDRIVSSAKPAAGGFGGGLLASLVHPLLPDSLGPTGKAVATVAGAVAGAAVLRFPPSVVAGISGAAGAKWFDAQRGRRATDRPAAAK